MSPSRLLETSVLNCPAAVVVMSDEKVCELGITPLSRIVTTPLNGSQTADNTFGLETMYVVGGQGMALIVESLI
jgi:hypothetical protein